MIGIAFSVVWSVLQLWFVLIVSFVAVMHAKAVLERGERIHWAFKVPLLVLGVVGWVADVLFNVTVAWGLFRDPPRELTLTSRLKRYKRDPLKAGARRHRIALWFCDQANKFDKGHC